MEEITRLNENIRLLKMHAAKVEAAGGVDVPLEAEVLTIKIDGLVLTTFPVRVQADFWTQYWIYLDRVWPLCGSVLVLWLQGELSVRIGLALKERSPHADTFITCYSNGYIFYSPTEEQLANPGAAQEDCDVMVGVGWQRLYEGAVERHLAEI